MENITDWLMVGVTIIYVLTTVFIFIVNRKSAEAAKEAVEVSKKQFEESIRLQKQHNYDSVRPAVTIDFSSDDKGDSFSGSVSITNHGLGPAIIKEMKFYKNDNEYINTNGYCTFYDLVCFRIAEEQEQLFIKKVFNYFYTKEFRNDNENKDYLAINENLVLLKFNTENEQEARIVGRIFHGVHMELVYSDIYNSNDWRIINRLSYFKPDWIDKRKVYRSNHNEKPIV